MSTPIFASVVNRVRTLYSLSFPRFEKVVTDRYHGQIIEERLAVGKGPIGFLNPTLYANPGLLHDIVKGNNLGCGTDGFLTAPGWDPVTGLGTPDYPKMLDFFLSLP